ncbi:HET-domain-containing protein, partial [Cadophora sp. DSE1049]
GRFHDSHDEVFAGLEPYKHKPLGSPTSFRLLLLKSGSKGPLECDLIEHSVDTVLKFDAVSYTWGSPLPPRYIKCDGKSLQITQNCEDALYKIRLPSRGRLIWVDSICIDQTAENNEEKNQQLQLMGHIYGHASHVLAWIGPGN